MKREQNPDGLFLDYVSRHPGYATVPGTPTRILMFSSIPFYLSVLHCMKEAA